MAAVGCGGPVVEPTVLVELDGLILSHPDGVQRVVLLDPDGVPVLTRRLPDPVPEVGLDQGWERAGTWSVEVSTRKNSWTLPVEVALPGPVSVSLEAPVGQQAWPLADGDERQLLLVDGAPAEVALTVVALQDGPVRLRLGEEQAEAQLRAGERLVLRGRLSAPTDIVVEAGTHRRRARLSPRVVTAEELGRSLSIEAVDLPADGAGLPDVARPAGRVTLPATWWRSTLRALGLGVRAQDPWAPWAHVGVVVHNRGDQPQNVLVRLRVLDEEGQPAAAFTPRVRDGTANTGAVQALLRVPAGAQARAALPLFVDESLLTSDAAASQRWTRVVDLTPLGSPAAVAQATAPLYVSRGSTVASLGLLVALGAALAGSLLLLRRGPGWLSRAPTSELMTIALFGSLTFVVSAVGRLLTMGVATVLGPFATLLTGLVDDCLRYSLLATLVCLLPRVGTASLAVLVGWLLSGFAMGTFSPTDLLFVGGRVFWLESLLWLTGVTRGTAWLDQSRWLRWLRLALGFGLASLLTSATGLVLHVTLYRLFLADWYVALILALPGFAYVGLAVAMAVPFAESLRQVQR